MSYESESPLQSESLLQFFGYVLDSQERKYFMFKNDTTLWCVRDQMDEEEDPSQPKYINYTKKGFVYDEDKKVVLYKGDDEMLRNWYNE